jgi:hypothetical protein
VLSNNYFYILFFFSLCFIVPEFLVIRYTSFWNMRLPDQSILSCSLVKLFKSLIFFLYQQQLSFAQCVWYYELKGGFSLFLPHLHLLFLPLPFFLYCNDATMSSLQLFARLLIKNTLVCDGGFFRFAIESSVERHRQKTCACVYICMCAKIGRCCRRTHTIIGDRIQNTRQKRMHIVPWRWCTLQRICLCVRGRQLHLRALVCLLDWRFLSVFFRYTEICFIIVVAQTNNDDNEFN